MKKTIVFLIVFIFSQNLLGQENSRVFYTVKKENLKKSDDELFSFNTNVVEITLKTDHTFEFNIRPMYNSCSTWRDYNGNWEQKNDTIFFYDKYNVVENDFNVKYETRLTEKEFTLEFSTDKKSKLTNKKIEIQYMYEFDDNLDDVEKIFTLNSENIIKIPFSEIPNYESLASIRIEYMLNGNKKRYGYLTENEILNEKEKEIPNRIKIEFVEKIKAETINRTIKGIIKNDLLKILETTQNKSKLPDYTEKITFEKEYKLNIK
jgi:hypothetical protein